MCCHCATSGRLGCLPRNIARGAIWRVGLPSPVEVEQGDAEAASVSLPTIKRLEANDGPMGGRSGTGVKIQTALEAAGVVFIERRRSRRWPQKAQKGRVDGAHCGEHGTAAPWFRR